MTARNTEHGTIVVERTYAASPARVFAAWSDREALAKWSAPGDGWTARLETFDFRPGGSQVNDFGPPEGPRYVEIMRYEDIVPDTRIVTTGNISSGGAVLSAGTMTVEFVAEGSGCHLKMTEQSVFLDGNGAPSEHQQGWTVMFDQLGAYLGG